MSIASLLAADPDGLSGKEAALGLQAFDRVQARLDGQRVGYVARFDESMHWATVGSRSAASWLASHTDLATIAAQSLVKTTRDLASMPVTKTASVGGELSWVKTRMLARTRSTKVKELFDAQEDVL